jgi:hypothetical protein
MIRYIVLFAISRFAVERDDCNKDLHCMCKAIVGVIANPDFCTYCLEKFNTRWNQFDFKIYVLAYFLHPLYRGMYVELSLFPIIFITN